MGSANPQDAASVQNPEGFEAERSAGQARSESVPAPSLALEPLVWTAPFYLRYRLPLAAGGVLTLAWLSFSITIIGNSLGWGEISLLLPHELGGLFAGVATPIALVWMVIAFFERGRDLKRETEALRWQLSQLAYPSDRAESRLKEITESLRRQARELSQATEEAAGRAEAVGALVKRRAPTTSANPRPDGAAPRPPRGRACPRPRKHAKVRARAA